MTAPSTAPIVSAGSTSEGNAPTRLLPAVEREKPCVGSQCSVTANSGHEEHPGPDDRHRRDGLRDEADDRPARTLAEHGGQYAEGDPEDEGRHERQCPRAAA